ncbi:hypothetical protein HPB50_009928 [Hyalomma asiaticum]|uniref:Uncharacterized protein n=1 Tax=Hyalomma asiaticum TaxID=266040 RepID=A0ACB7S675_HYAAI|nr:hypothetical protein HPB50_009928 [Hyalomma asiaticum]
MARFTMRRRATRVPQMCPFLRLLVLLLLLLLASFQRQLLRRTTTKAQALRLHRTPRTIQQPLRSCGHCDATSCSQEDDGTDSTYIAYRRLNDCPVPTRLRKTASVWDFPASVNRTLKWGLSEKSNEVTPRALARTKPVTAMLRRSGPKEPRPSSGSSDTSSEDSFSVGLSSVGESDIEMGTLREVKRGHTSSACSDETSDGHAETQRPKRTSTFFRNVEVRTVICSQLCLLDAFRGTV